MDIQFVVGLAVAAAGLGVLVYGLHRLAVWLEDQGYLYYRKKREGGSSVAAAMREFDRITRPSVEHVIQVEDQADYERPATPEEED